VKKSRFQVSKTTRLATAGSEPAMTFSYFLRLGASKRVAYYPKLVRHSWLFGCRRVLCVFSTGKVYLILCVYALAASND